MQNSPPPVPRLFLGRRSPRSISLWWLRLIGLGSALLLSLGCQQLPQSALSLGESEANPVEATGAGSNPLGFRLFPSCHQQIDSLDRLSLDQETAPQVTLQGQVLQVAPFLEGQMYLLADNTGQVWVLSSQKTVQSGDRLLVQGRVQHQEVFVKNQDWGDRYLTEEAILKHQPATLEVSLTRTCPHGYSP